MTGAELFQARWAPFWTIVLDEPSHQSQPPATLDGLWRGGHAVFLKNGVAQEHPRLPGSSYLVLLLLFVVHLSLPSEAAQLEKHHSSEKTPEQDGEEDDVGHEEPELRATFLIVSRTR